MDTLEIPVPGISDENQAIIEHLITGKPLDSALARRIRERGERFTEQIERQHGVVDIGVPAIRQLRDGE